MIETILNEIKEIENNPSVKFFGNPKLDVHFDNVRKKIRIKIIDINPGIALASRLYAINPSKYGGVSHSDILHILIKTITFETEMILNKYNGDADNTYKLNVKLLPYLMRRSIEDQRHFMVITVLDKKPHDNNLSQMIIRHGDWDIRKRTGLGLKSVPTEPSIPDKYVGLLGWVDNKPYVKQTDPNKKERPRPTLLDLSVQLFNRLIRWVTG